MINTLKTVINERKLNYYEAKIKEHNEIAARCHKATEKLKPLIDDMQIREIYNSCLDKTSKEDAKIVRYCAKYYNLKYFNA